MKRLNKALSGLLLLVGLSVCLPVAVMAETKTVAPDGLGLQLSIPKTWTSKRIDNHTVVFSGPQNTNDWLTTITISNQRIPSDSKTGLEGEKQMMASYIASLEKRGPDHEILFDAPLSLTRESLSDEGIQAVVRFQGKNEPMRQWVVIIPRKDVNAAHLFIYSAPDALFEYGLPNAQNVINKMRLLPSSK